MMTLDIDLIQFSKTDYIATGDGAKFWLSQHRTRISAAKTTLTVSSQTIIAEIHLKFVSASKTFSYN